MTYYESIYSYPPVMFMHIIGHFMDSYLFIYLVNHFFLPLKGTTVSRRQTVFMTFIFAAVLFFVDIISDNNYYTYFLAMLVLPLLYSILFFRDRLIMKIVICSIFSLLVLSFENLFVQITSAFHVTAESDYTRFLLLFFIRRIGCKVLLFWIIKELFLWPRELKIQLPTECWLLILAVSAGDNLLFLLNVPQKLDNTFLNITLTCFLVALLIFLLLIVKYLSIGAEKNRVMSTQMAESKIHNQYLQQQLKMTESLRKFRHDYKAHLFCMDTLLEAGKYEELHQYLLSLHQYQYEGVHLRRYVDDESLNIILNQKATVAEKYGIRFDTSIDLPTNGKIIMSDLNSLIVNLCDNAIEACATLPDAGISLYINKVKAYLIIEVTNTSATDVQKTNPEFRTGKSNPEFHGMGIKIIKSITEKYNGLYQVFSSEHSFTTNLMLLDE